MDTTYRLTPHIVYHFESSEEKDDFLEQIGQKEPSKKSTNIDLTNMSVDELRDLFIRYQAYATDMLKAGNIVEFQKLNTISLEINKAITRKVCG